MNALSREPVPPPPVELDLERTTITLCREGRLIALSACLGIALAFLFIITVSPLYRAEALILVAPSEQNPLSPLPQAMPNNAMLSARVESEVEILRSEAMALAVVGASDLVLDPEFGPQLSTIAKLRVALGLPSQSPPAQGKLVQDTVAKVMGARDIRRRGLTSVIAITITAKDPTRAADLANQFAETYVTEQIRAKVTASTLQRDALQAHVTKAHLALSQSEERLDRYLLTQASGQSGADAVSNAVAQNLQQIEATRRATSQAYFASQEALLSKDWARLSELVDSAALKALAAQYQSLETQLQRTAPGPADFDMKQALSSLEAEIETEAGRAFLTLTQDIETSEYALNQQRASLGETLLETDLPSEALAEIYALQQQAQLARAQYQSALRRMSDLAAQTEVQVADARLVSAALPPAAPAFPTVGLTLALGGAVFMVLGMLLALLRDQRNPKLRSAAHLHTLTGKAPLLILPGDAAHRGAGRAFRRLNYRLLQDATRQTGQPQIIHLLTPHPQPLLAASIAESLADMGQSTAVVDAATLPDTADRKSVTENAQIADLILLHQSDPEIGALDLADLVLIIGQDGVTEEHDICRALNEIRLCRKPFETVFLGRPSPTLWGPSAAEQHA